jgi:probable HAF family extracellular repeat protein
VGAVVTVSVIDLDVDERTSSIAGTDVVDPPADDELALAVPSHVAACSCVPSGAALILAIDPIGLVDRTRRHSDSSCASWNQPQGAGDEQNLTKPKQSSPCGLRAFSCAVIWRDGRPTAIGPDGSYGYGINDDDDVVGEFLDGSNAFRAFVYRDGVFSDLNALVPAGSPVLEEARAINDAGWIVANGNGRAFVLIPR